MTVKFVCNRGKKCNNSPDCWKTCFHTFDQRYALYEQHIFLENVNNCVIEEYLPYSEKSDKPKPGERRYDIDLKYSVYD